MSENQLQTTGLLSTMAGFTGILVVVSGTEMLSQTEIVNIGLVLIATGIFGIAATMLIENRDTISAAVRGVGR